MKEKKFLKWIIIFILILMIGAGSKIISKKATEIYKEIDNAIEEENLSEQEYSTIALGEEAEKGVNPLSELPEYEGEDYTFVNGNIPFFNKKEKVNTKVFEEYSPLDKLGRCGVAYANICKELMPTEKRGEIGMIKPAGWHTVKYDCVDGKYLYNRCHLIAFMLAGENANACNLITGTRYFNVNGMLPFENMVSDYVKETNNHVLYRVTPLYKGGNLIASGVLMEAYSVEDNGAGVCFCVFIHNIQPGITINYATGESKLK